MDFRIALFPYLYTANHRTRRTGVSLLHPIYYEAPHLAKSYTVPSEYFFGSEVIVQPVVAPIAEGQVGITVASWLPPGVWVDWSGQTVHSSGAAGLEVSDDYALHEIPMFVRAGAIIPMRTSASLKSTLAFSDPLVWGVWAASTESGVSSGNATVIEDDGATLNFEHGATASTTMHWSRPSGDGSSLTLLVQPTTGSFDVQCAAESGYEYGGVDADLQAIQDVGSAGACCDACSAYSNCAFWTWTKDASVCTLKVSRRGRRTNSSTVSGVAQRRMPTTRVHVFQVRSSQYSTKPPSSVAINGKALQRVDPPRDNQKATAAVGWYVQPKQVPTLLTADGALVIVTASMPLNQPVEVTVTAAVEARTFTSLKCDDHLASTTAPSVNDFPIAYFTANIVCSNDANCDPKALSEFRSLPGPFNLAINYYHSNSWSHSSPVPKSLQNFSSSYSSEHVPFSCHSFCIHPVLRLNHRNRCKLPLVS